MQYEITESYDSETITIIINDRVATQHNFTRKNIRASLEIPCFSQYAIYMAIFIDEIRLFSDNSRILSEIFAEPIFDFKEKQDYKLVLRK